MLNVLIFASCIYFEPTLTLFSLAQVFLKMLVGTGEKGERKQDMDGGKEGRKEDHGIEEDTEEEVTEEEDNLFISFILRLMRNYL